MLTRHIFAGITAFAIMISISRAGDPAISHAVCQDISVELDSNGEFYLSPVDVDGGSTYNSSADVNPYYISCVDAGTVVDVILTVHSSDGSSDSCTAHVSVTDGSDPVAVCQDITVQLDAAGNASITADDVDGGSHDECTIVNKFLDNSSFTCADIGVAYVMLTVEDPSGNQGSCQAAVTVEDNIPPAFISCPAPRTVGTQPPLNVALVPDFTLDATADDNCTFSVLFSQDPPPGNEIAPGTNVIHIIATDYSDNSTTCTTELIVLKMDPPGLAILNDPVDYAIDYDQSAITLVGSYSNIYGQMIWTNSFGGTSGSVDYTNNSFAATVSLVPGFNLVTLRGSNINGMVATTQAAIIRALPPVLHWRFDENVGTNATESISGRTNVATLVGPVSHVAGIAAGSTGAISVLESGPVSYVDAGTLALGNAYEKGANSNYMVLGSAWTITAWINLPSSQPLFDDRVIISSDTGGPSTWWLFFLRSNNGKFNELGFDFSSSRQFSGINVPLNTSVFVCVQVNTSGFFGSTNKYRFVVWDGTSWHSGEGTDHGDIRLQGLEIGSFNTGTREFQGTIDDVRIYSSALVQDDLDRLTMADTDGDGTPDFLDNDDDGDGLPDASEQLGGTNPKNADTDGDSQSDSEEQIAGTSASDSNSFFSIDAVYFNSNPTYEIMMSSGRVYTFEAEVSPGGAPHWQTTLIYTSGFNGTAAIFDPSGLPNVNYRVKVHSALPPQNP